MQKGFSGIYILIGLALLLGGLYYFGKLPIKLPSSQSPTPTVSTAQPTELDETANWKTYTDNQLGISFKYPPNGSLDTATDGTNTLTLYLNNSSEPPYYLFTLQVKDNQQGLTAKQVLENEVQTLRNNKNIPGGGAKILADYRESTIQDYQSGIIDGFSMRWGRDGDSVNDSFEVMSINNNKIYTFSIHDGNGSVEEFQKNLMDQILSTFRFD